MLRETPTQAVAMPFRQARASLEVLIITTSAGGWGFPKGSVELGETPPEAALREAREEAGLRGDLIVPALGTYRYLKRSGRTHLVSAYAMTVERLMHDWDEAHRRERRWVRLADAVTLLEQPALRRLALRLPEVASDAVEPMRFAAA